MLNLIIQLISGAVGGNLAGTVLKDSSLGPIGNTIAGLIGGGVGGQILSMLIPALAGAATSGGGMDMNAILGQIAGAGVGGGALMAIVGMAKQMMAKKA
jgi:uncharacterized membrane protein YeaQ/YmgE (transglycosylase-associated protein family)